MASITHVLRMTKLRVGLNIIPGKYYTTVIEEHYAGQKP